MPMQKMIKARITILNMVMVMVACQHSSIIPFERLFQTLETHFYTVNEKTTPLIDMNSFNIINSQNPENISNRYCFTIEL